MKISKIELYAAFNEYKKLDGIEFGAVQKNLMLGFLDWFLKKNESKWISIEDKPLIRFLEDGKRWETTFACDTEFIAAVETNKGWWIRYCFISENGQLVVITDDDEEIAGWEPTDVTHYMFLDKPIKKP